MPRIRRTPEAARENIIQAARRLLIEEGPRSLKLQRVGKEAGVSHASVLHYFGSIDGLTVAVVKDDHRKRREALRAELSQIPTKEKRGERLDHALAALSDRDQGRLTASLLSLGLDPFPPEEELGLASIAALISDLTDFDIDQARRMVLANVLAMVGEAMVGSHMRARLGVEDTESERTNFRRWLMGRLTSA
ncbi:MAG: TetR/AcrR family transcriptional regulator [Myxococcota bacterium]